MTWPLVLLTAQVNLNFLCNCEWPPNDGVLRLLSVLVNSITCISNQQKQIYDQLFPGADLIHRESNFCLEIHCREFFLSQSLNYMFIFLTTFWMIQTCNNTVSVGILSLHFVFFFSYKHYIIIYYYILFIVLLVSEVSDSQTVPVYY